MSELVLAQEELFHGVRWDIWMNKNREPFMTIQQLSDALEYHSKSGIENIINRNPYLKEDEFSSTHKLGVVEGGRIVKRETIVFTRDGIMEVSFLSHKPRAREFRSWARKVINSFVDGQLVWKEKREIGKQTRLSMTDAIRDAGFSHHFYKHFQNLCYKTAIGFDASQVRKSRNVQKTESILDYLTVEEQEAVNQREQQIATLITLGMDYKQIKAVLANGGVIYKTTLKIPKKEMVTI